MYPQSQIHNYIFLQYHNHNSEGKSNFESNSINCSTQKQCMLCHRVITILMTNNKLVKQPSTICSKQILEVKQEKG